MADHIRATLRNLSQRLNEAIGLLPADEPVPTPEAIAEALSHNETREALYMALRAEVATAEPRVWLYIVDIYDTHLIYRQSGVDDQETTYRRAYVIDLENGTVTFGDPQQVIAQTVYTPVGESAGPTPASEAAGTITGDPIPLVEAALTDGNTVAIKLIDPGWGSSGYYSADVLRRDGPQVFRAGTHMYIDHPSESEAIDRPERSVRDLAGALVTDARWEDNGPAGPGLYADALVTGPLREVLDDIAPHIGVSIRASGYAQDGEAEGRAGRVITSLVSAESVDFVTRAGRGGQVLPLIESARAGRPVTHREQETRVAEQELTEAQQARITALETELRQMRERAVITEATAQVAAALAGTELHDLTRQRITESLVARAPVTEAGALDREAFATAITEAVNAALAEYAAVIGAGRVRGVGPSEGAPDTERIAQLDAETDAALREAGLLPASQAQA